MESFAGIINIQASLNSVGNSSINLNIGYIKTSPVNTPKLELIGTQFYQNQKIFTKARVVYAASGYGYLDLYYQQPSSYSGDGKGKGYITLLTPNNSVFNKYISYNAVGTVNDDQLTLEINI